jgi:hypothetical protein
LDVNRTSFSLCMSFTCTHSLFCCVNHREKRETFFGGRLVDCLSALFHLSSSLSLVRLVRLHNCHKMENSDIAKVSSFNINFSVSSPHTLFFVTRLPLSLSFVLSYLCVPLLLHSLCNVEHEGFSCVCVCWD